MNRPDAPGSQDSNLNQPLFLKSQLAAPITAGLLSWLAITIGFLGLKMLMQERPEFVGQPMRITKPVQP
jgi:hypothetical protein